MFHLFDQFNFVINLIKCFIEIIFPLKLVVIIKFSQHLSINYLNFTFIY